MTGAAVCASAAGTQPSALLRALFPSDVFAFERREAGIPGLLLPAEAAASAKFAPKRIAEFAAGRDCARRAMRAAGFAGEDVLIRPDRSPQWPAGVAGSITHTGGFCGAAVASQASYGGIGIDAETVDRVMPGLWPLVFTPAEIAMLDALSAAERTRAAAAVFSAKESFYKCQSPITGMWIDFHEVQVDLRDSGADSGEFTIQTLSAACSARFAGRTLSGKFCFDGSLVLTGMTIGSAELNA